MAFTLTFIPTKGPGVNVGAWRMARRARAAAKPLRIGGGLEQCLGPLGEAVVGERGDEDARVEGAAHRSPAFRRSLTRVPGAEIEIGGRDRAGLHWTFTGRRV